MTYKGYTIEQTNNGICIYCGSALIESGLYSVDDAKQSIDQFGE